MTRKHIFVLVLILSVGALAASIASPAHAAGVVGDGTPASCTESALIDALSFGGLVTFNCGGPKTILVLNAKTIATDTTIDGGGTITLSGDNARRLFVVNNGVSLHLKNIALEKGSANYGGAIYNNGFLTLESTTIRNSVASENGGAINTLGSLDMITSTLENNTAKNGGALFATTTNAHVTLTHSSLHDNQAAGSSTPDGRGGALVAFGGATVNISSSDIYSNTASDSGGALSANYLNASVSVTDSTFSNNRVANTVTSAGGAIWMGEQTRLTLTGGSIISNSAHSGGGLYVTANATVTLTDTMFSGNSALAEGGGLENHGAITLTDTIFSGNSARFGGGLENYGVISLTDTTFNGNSVLDQGGGLANFGTIKLTNTIFTGNSAPGYGGGLANFETITLTNASFADNSASYGGGGVYNFGVITLTNATFTSNSALALGGGLFNENLSRAMLLKVTFSGNSSTQAGGGIFNEALDTSMRLVAVTLDGNSAGQGGGLANYGVITLTNTTLSNNRAVSTTAGYGGGLLNAGMATLIDATLSGNSAKAAGGGLYNDQGVTTLNNVTLSGNSAVTGGSLDNYFGRAILTNSTLSGNSAKTDGGGLYNDHGVTMLNNVTVTGNTAARHGGAFYHIASAIDQVTRLKNTIVANSPSGGNCFAEPGSTTGIISNGFNLSSDASCSFNQLSDWNNVAANLGPLANNGGPTLTHIAFPPSKAVEGGSDCPVTDQRGMARPQGPACDIGAVEYVPGELSPWLYLPLILR